MFDIILEPEGNSEQNGNVQIFVYSRFHKTIPKSSLSLPLVVRPLKNTFFYVCLPLMTRPLRENFFCGFPYVLLCTRICIKI